jgi:hypothetical protein
MKLSTILTISIFALGIYSCNFLDWNREVHKSYNKETFDPQIFKELKMFDTIKNLLVSNINEIYDQRNKGHHPNKTKQTNTDDIARQNPVLQIPIYLYDKGINPDSIILGDLPPRISQKIDTILKIIGTDKIISFSMRKKHSNFAILLKDNYNEETDVEIKHTLVWHWSGLRYSVKFKKDTILADDWKYYILCFYQHQANLK